jgi:hypothetical protein
MVKLKRIYESILRETDDYRGKDLLVVDIQPIYESGFNHWLGEFVEFLNENYESFKSLTFYYNGDETVGTISKSDYQIWWYTNDLNEEITNEAKFYDKGYAFFRYCMDEDIDNEDISNLVRMMVEFNINDSRELDKSFWDTYIKRYGSEDVRELVEFSDDCIHIPDLMDDLKNYNNIVICGGGENECLKEVNIALDALNKNYKVLNKFVYY